MITRKNLTIIIINIIIVAAVVVIVVIIIIIIIVVLIMTILFIIPSLSKRSFSEPSAPTRIPPKMLMAALGRAVGEFVKRCWSFTE